MRWFAPAVVVAAVLIAVVAPASGGARPVPLEQQVGRLIVTGFPGTTAPGWLRRRLARGQVGGVILFGYNVRSRAQVAALDASIQRAAGGDALVTIDQEGGQVRRLPWASPLRDGSQQSTTGIAYWSARAAARDLRAAGVNVNFAPVADVALGPGAEMRRRAFPGGAANVAKLVRASLRGYRHGRMAATVKHFPGLGAARVNTDDATVRIQRTRAQMNATELAPFRAAIAADVPVVMASHAVFPAYDARNLASQSSAVLTGLLRKQLGFRGVVATDGLEARAVLARSSVAAAAERSIRAGADLVLLTGSGSYLPVYRHLLAQARRSPAFRARVARSAARIRALEETVAPSLAR